jgi:tetratricopeptide (TPR) repeat protein
MQETLLGELSTTRRVRLHGQVGEALERRWPDRSERYAGRLAVHFSESAMLTPAHAEKAVHYSRIAGEQAEARFAWDEAVRWYEQCFQLDQLGGDSPAVDDPDLLLAHGRCMRYLARYRDAMRSLMRAMTAYRAQDRGTGTAEAALEALQIDMPPERHRQIADDALALMDPAEVHLRARLLAQRAAWIVDDERAESAATEALELARNYDLKDVEGLVLGQRVLHRASWNGDVESGISAGERAFLLLREGHLDRLAGTALNYTSRLALACGDLERALADANRLRSFADERHDQSSMDLALSILAWHSYWRGDYETALEHLALASNPRVDLAWTRTMIAAERGADQLDQFLPNPADAGGVPHFLATGYASRASGFLLLGDPESARRELAEVENLFWSCRGSAVATLGVLIFADDALPAVASDALAAELEEILERWEWARGWGDRLRGRLAFRRAEFDEAEQHFRTGVEVATQLEWVVILGRCLQGLAEIAELRGNRDEARAHLDRAGELFAQYGAKLYLDQVLAKKEILKA